MRYGCGRLLLGLAASAAGGGWFHSLDAQARAIPACSLLSKTDVAGVTQRTQFTDPDLTPLAGGGSACTFDNAQLVLFSGANSDDLWNAYLKNFGHQNDTRHPVSGIGDGAYFFYPKPRDQYEGVNAVVVVHVGQHTLAVSVEAEQGNSADSVQPQALALAKMVWAKLR